MSSSACEVTLIKETYRANVNGVKIEITDTPYNTEGLKKCSEELYHLILYVIKRGRLLVFDIDNIELLARLSSEIPILFVITHCEGHTQKETKEMYKDKLEKIINMDNMICIYNRKEYFRIDMTKKYEKSRNRIISLIKKYGDNSSGYYLNKGNMNDQEIL